MNITGIIRAIDKNAYVCDNCGKSGNQTNMRLVIGVGLFHAKCKSIKLTNIKVLEKI